MEVLQLVLYNSLLFSNVTFTPTYNEMENFK